MEKHETFGLLMFIGVAVIGAVLLVTSTINMDETGMAVQHISQKNIDTMKNTNYNNCAKDCGYSKNSCAGTAYNAYIVCQGRYTSENCQSKLDKAEIACGNTYYSCQNKCQRYLQ